MLSKLLAHPLTKDLSVDDPRTTLLRKKIIRDKPFLYSIYLEWYKTILALLPDKNNILELGSGAGFLPELLPGVITSEILPTPDVKLIANGSALPLKTDSLNGIVMTDVLHHVPNVDQFFDEATRCLKASGKIIMIEPWRTAWSEWVYKNIHPEPFEPEADWNIPSTGPLSGANGALPWILFQRDKKQFAARFPHLEIKNIRPIMPISYLLSGGVSMRNLMPGVMHKPIRFIENLFEHQACSMFAVIELQRI